MPLTITKENQCKIHNSNAKVKAFFAFTKKKHNIIIMLFSYKYINHTPVALFNWKSILSLFSGKSSHQVTKGENLIEKHYYRWNLIQRNKCL